MDHEYTSGLIKLEKVSPVPMDQSKSDHDEDTIIEGPVSIVDEVENSVYIKDGEIFDSDMKPVLLRVSGNAPAKKRIILKGDLLTFISNKEAEKEREKEKEKQVDKPSGQKWTREAINLLISLRTQLHDYFENPKNKKMDYWSYLSSILCQAGYEISGPDCHTKWRNLCCTYRMNMEKAHRLGSQAVRWEFFEQMEACLKNRSLHKNCNDDYDDDEEISDDELEMSRLLKIQSKMNNSKSSLSATVVKRPDPPQATSAIQPAMPSTGSGAGGGSSASASGGSSTPAKRQRASSPPPWFKDYIQKRELEEKIRDDRFFSILEAIKESELRKTALLETLLQYFDRN